MKRLAITLSIIIITVIPQISRSQTVTLNPYIADLRSGMGAWPSPATSARAVPVQVAAGSARTWVSIRWGAVALAAFDLWIIRHDIEKSCQAFPKFAEWLTSVGMTCSGDSKLKSSVTGTCDIAAGSSTGSCAETALAAKGVSGYERYSFPSGYDIQAAKQAASYKQAPTAFCLSPEGLWNDVPCGVSGMHAHIWACGAYYNNPGYTCPINGQRKVFYRVDGGTCTGSGTKYTETTGPQVNDRLQQDLAQNPIPQAAQRAQEEIERRGEEILNSPAGENEDGKKAISDAILPQVPQSVKDAIKAEGEATANNDGQVDNVPSSPTKEIIQPCYPDGPPCKVTGDWNDTQAAPVNITDTAINNSENVETLGGDPAGIGTKTDQENSENSKFITYMTNLKNSVTSLKNSIMSLINQAINVESPQCSFSGASVYGGNFSINFCDVDFTAWRIAVIAIFSIVAVIMLIAP